MMILRLVFRERIVKWELEGKNRVGRGTVQVHYKDYDTSKMGDWILDVRKDMGRWEERIIHSNTPDYSCQVEFLALFDLDSGDDYSAHVWGER